MENKNCSLLSKDFLLIALLVTSINIFSMPRMQNGGDAQVVRYEAMTLINEGTIVIPARIAATFGDQGQYFFYNHSSDKWYSKYGILNTLMYVPALYAEKLLTGRLEFKSNDRVLTLDCMNIVCALATTAYLFMLAGLYTDSLFIKAAYILSAFYCTFWWNHMRIQAFEAYQPFFLIGAVWHFIRAFHALPGEDASAREKIIAWNLFFSGLLLGLLWLSKALYVLVAFLFVALIVCFEWNNLRREGGFAAGRVWKRARVYFIWFGIPLLFFFAVLLVVNTVKFGSPFDNGYTQWKKEQNLFSGDLLSGVLGFLFDPQFSIFLTFPVLVVALFGLPEFFRKYRRDAIVIYSLGTLLLLANAKFVNWRGLWSYGPRYMLPVLGMMSLPFVLVLGRIAGNFRKPAHLSAALAILVVLGYSTGLQMNVNALPFNAYFQIKEKAIDPLGDETLNRYFATRPFGVICGDILAYKHGRPLWFRERVAQLSAGNPQALARLDMYLNGCSGSNCFLFPPHD